MHDSVRYIGQQIRIIRQAKGLTQENMADLLSMSSSGYAKIERGESDISTSRLLKISKVLEIRASVLLEETENEVSDVHLGILKNESVSTSDACLGNDLEGQFGELGRILKKMSDRLEVLENTYVSKYNV